MMARFGIGLALAVAMISPALAADDRLTRKELARSMEYGAKLLRKQLPMKIDQITTLWSVISLPDALIYHYRLEVSKGDIDISVFKREARRIVTYNACTHADMRWLMDNGGRYKYDYIGVDGLRIAEITVTSSSC